MLKTVVTIPGFSRHLWYLSEEMVGLAFFDSSVTEEQKKLMVHNIMEKEGSEVPPKRCDALNQADYEEKQISDFVTTSTMRFFEALDLPKTFLTIPPSDWADDADFQKAAKIVHSRKVVNDVAERGVKLIQDFNSSLTKNEDQKQYLLQVVNEHRHIFCDANKATVVAGLSK